MSDTNHKKTLLAIMAHPDDESFGIGGTLAKYAAQGVDVHLICATGGEIGTVDPELLEGYDSIAELRSAELHCAAEKLGLASVTMAGYRDSGMPGADSNRDPGCLLTQPTEYVARHFAQIMRRLRPHVVITHDPIGNYKHPDHIACNRATELAFKLVGDPEALPETDHPAWQPQRLYYNTMPKGLLKTFARIGGLMGMDMRRFGRNKDINLIDLIESGDFPIHAEVDYRKHLLARNDAAACHKSQLDSGPPNRGILALIMRLYFGRDQFMQAYPEPQTGKKVRDLFEGI